MRIALLGAMGFVGKAAARELAGRAEVRHLLLVDYNVREARKFAKTLSPKCGWAMSDVGRASDLGRLLGGVDAVASAVGPCREYEKSVLLTCAGSGVPAASIGDAEMPREDRREVHDAFRRAGAVAVSGCGMMPGWTELLSTHFLGGGRTGNSGSAPRTEKMFLFFRPDLFGGYAFFRRIVREVGPSLPPPSRFPAGRYFESGARTVIGIPCGRPAAVFRGMTGGLGKLGTAGRELSAAFLFWLRGVLAPVGNPPPAAAGLLSREGGSGDFAAVFDPGGRLAGTLLAEAVLRLARGRGKTAGLLPLPDLIGKAEAEGIAASCNAEILGGRSGPATGPPW